MKRIGILIFVLLMSLIFSGNLLARQSGGGVSDGLKGVCELAGGSWTGSEASGTWACCWANWGCYGCINNVCKMQCRTERCRGANGTVRPSRQQKVVKDLAPTGMKAPIVPKNATPEKNPKNMHIN